MTQPDKLMNCRCMAGCICKPAQPSSPNRLSINDLDHHAGTITGNKLTLIGGDGKSKTISVHDLVSQLTDTMRQNERLNEEILALKSNKHTVGAQEAEIPSKPNEQVIIRTQKSYGKDPVAEACMAHKEYNARIKEKLCPWCGTEQCICATPKE